MFGRATIRLGIGPHSSIVLYFIATYKAFIHLARVDVKLKLRSCKNGTDFLDHHGQYDHDVARTVGLSMRTTSHVVLPTAPLAVRTGLVLATFNGLCARMCISKQN